MKAAKSSYTLMLMADFDENQLDLHYPIKSQLDGRDSVMFSVKGDKAEMSVVGCEVFLNLIREKIKNEGADPRRWSLPSTASHVDLLVKEIILKAQGRWKLPYEQTEICHCRAVATHKVDQAIVAGAHDCASVSRQTGASTACGTCRPDVQKLIDYRLSYP